MRADVDREPLLEVDHLRSLERWRLLPELLLHEREHLESVRVFRWPTRTHLPHDRADVDVVPVHLGPDDPSEPRVGRGPSSECGMRRTCHLPDVILGERPPAHPEEPELRA